MATNWNRTPYGEFDYTKANPECLYNSKQGERIASLETNHANLKAMLEKLEKDLSEDMKAEVKRLSELMERNHNETKTLVKSIQKTAEETQEKLDKVTEDYTKFKQSVKIIFAKFGVIAVIALSALSYLGSHAVNFVIDKLRG